MSHAPQPLTVPAQLVAVLTGNATTAPVSCWYSPHHEDITAARILELVRLAQLGDRHKYHFCWPSPRGRLQAVIVGLGTHFTTTPVACWLLSSTPGQARLPQVLTAPQLVTRVTLLTTSLLDPSGNTPDRIDLINRLYHAVVLGEARRGPVYGQWYEQADYLAKHLIPWLCQEDNATQLDDLLFYAEEVSTERTPPPHQRSTTPIGHHAATIRRAVGIALTLEQMLEDLRR